MTQVSVLLQERTAVLKDIRRQADWLVVGSLCITEESRQFALSIRHLVIIIMHNSCINRTVDTTTTMD